MALCRKSGRLVLLVAAGLFFCLLFAGGPAGAQQPTPSAFSLPEKPPEFFQRRSLLDWSWRIGKRDKPFFKSDRLRWGKAGLLERTGADLAAVPLNVAWWDGGDWTKAFLVAAAAAGLMLPASPSPDAQFQAAIDQGHNPLFNRVFPHITTVELGTGAVAYLGATALAGALLDSRRTKEYAGLMTEALLVTHAFHISGKLLTGREPPDKNSGQGSLHGPERGSDIFPSGTPSGHAATVCTLAAVTLEYYDSVPLDAASVAACLYMSTSVLYNDQHFASDVVWGAAMGWFIGQWVARHRSSRVATDSRLVAARGPDIFIVPFGTDVESGIGVSVLVPFH